MMTSSAFLASNWFSFNLISLRCARSDFTVRFRCLGIFPEMAPPRRMQLTTLSLHSDVNSPSESALPPAARLVRPPLAPSSPAERTLSARIEVVLFEPDDARCAEFHYPRLIEVK